MSFPDDAPRPYRGYGGALPRRGRRQRAQRLRVVRGDGAPTVYRWRTAGATACPACQAREGRLFVLEATHPPLHPQCRCVADGRGTLPLWVWRAFLASGGNPAGPLPSSVERFVAWRWEPGAAILPASRFREGLPS